MKKHKYLNITSILEKTQIPTPANQQHITYACFFVCFNYSYDSHTHFSWNEFYCFQITAMNEVVLRQKKSKNNVYISPYSAPVIYLEDTSLTHTTFIYT